MRISLNNMKNKKCQNIIIKSMENIKVFAKKNSTFSLPKKNKIYNNLSMPLHLKIKIINEDQKTPTIKSPLKKTNTYKNECNNLPQLFKSHIIKNILITKKSSLKIQKNKNKSKQLLKNMTLSSSINIPKKEKKNIVENLPLPTNQELPEKCDYNNMPSYTKELRRALYSRSGGLKQSSLINDNNDINSHSQASSGNFSTSCKNDSFLSEKFVGGHMHEDNQTLLQLISDTKISNINNEIKNNISVENLCDNFECINNLYSINTNNIVEKQNTISEPVSEKFLLPHDNEFLLTISTTKDEVRRIQSKVETAKKMKLLNQSYSCNKCRRKISINKKENIYNIIEKPQHKKNSEKQIVDDTPIINEINEIKKHENFKPSSYVEINTYKMPIIMVASSLQKDIRKTYKFKEPLGGGHFGTIRKAYRKEDKNKKDIHYFAIKSISKKKLSGKDCEELIKEVDIISCLDHPNIIKFYETYHDDFYFHIVMELCSGRDSYDRIVIKEKCNEKKVVSLITKVLLAIAHCHSRGVTHRDLKPENILFESNKEDAEIKIIDFGLSRKFAKDEKMHSVLGTPYYVAPEVLKGDYNEKCDVWSIGAMAYLLLCGEPPFKGNTDHEIFQHILNDNVKFTLPIWCKVSNNAKSFVKLCLEKSPFKRPNAVQALDHPWFINVLNESHKMENLSVDIMINIKNFRIKQKFKQMVMKYLIYNMNEEEMKVYKSAFFAIDFFHNGCVEPPELKKAFELSNIPITDEEIQHLYKILDQNLKGAFDYTEFLMAGVNQNELFTKEKLDKAFKYFDMNKSGFIENCDLNDSLLRMGRECINANDVNFFIYEVLRKLPNKKGIERESEVFTKVSYEDFFMIFQENKKDNNLDDVCNKGNENNGINVCK